MRIPTIVICGNSASAALLLLALSRRIEAQRIVVIGAQGQLGQGIAYSTREKSHLLNVPADRMSADPRAPEQLSAWLAARGIATADGDAQFVPRALYADYLRQQVGGAACRNPGLQLEFVHGCVKSLVRNGAGWSVQHRDGALAADLVVLATGNDMPVPIAPNFPQVAGRIVDNPWRLPAALSGSVLILGTGLTAVDCAISLLDRGHRAPVILLSRHGLLPRTHVPPVKRPALPDPCPGTARSLVRALRAGAGVAAADSQGFMDAMRPHWHAVWDALPLKERQRALRHGATFWNIHRHRLAPAVAKRMAEGLDRNLRLARGRLTNLSKDGDKLNAHITSNGRARSLIVDWVINCTGPNSNPRKTRDPFLENIIESRYARAGSADIGLDVDVQNHVLDGQGQPQGTLFAMGALTRGRWWEITAIPEITRQAAGIAETIADKLTLTSTQESRFAS